jgi:hypothetical protein
MDFIVEEVSCWNWPLARLGGSVGKGGRPLAETMPVLDYMAYTFRIQIAREVQGRRKTYHGQIFGWHVIVNTNPTGFTLVQAEGWPR